MRSECRVVVVVNDEAGNSGLRAEHGWSAWIEYQGRHALLDTGSGQALAPNVAALSLPWERLEAVILSHGHYDHVGGLPDVFASARRPVLYCHPTAFGPKFARKAEGPLREIGLAPAIAASARSGAEKIVNTEQLTEVFPGLMVTGPVPRRTDFEDTGGPFYKDPQGSQPDELPDDQAVFFEAREGLVVLLGCAHAGVINTLQYIRKLRPGRKFHAVIGGMHLLHAAENRLERTLEGLEMLEVGQVHPAHCTGDVATKKLCERFQSRCSVSEAGRVYTFTLPDGVKINKEESV